MSGTKSYIGMYALNIQLYWNICIIYIVILKYMYYIELAKVEFDGYETSSTKSYTKYLNIFVSSYQ